MQIKEYEEFEEEILDFIDQHAEVMYSHDNAEIALMGEWKEKLKDIFNRVSRLRIITLEELEKDE